MISGSRCRFCARSLTCSNAPSGAIAWKPPDTRAGRGPGRKAAGTAASAGFRLQSGRFCGALGGTRTVRGRDVVTIRFGLLCLAMGVLAACGSAPAPEVSTRSVPLYPGETPELRQLINSYADHYEVPRALVHKVVQRESDYRPRARNGPYYGMMQILPATARGIGFRGAPEDLLDADTNMKYAVKYLRG